MKQNIWLDGVMGVIVGDALGCPVQFLTREQIKKRGYVTGMEGYGTFLMPPGSWTDDGSMTLATLDSIRNKGNIDLVDICERFVQWYLLDAYTPTGYAYDMGMTCSAAIEAFEETRDVKTCGRTSEDSNGNGSLMRIIPACLYAFKKAKDEEEAIGIVHAVSGLTHNHLRSKVGCGLYYFCVAAILEGSGTLGERLQVGLDKGFAFYEKDAPAKAELAFYERLRDLTAFSGLPKDAIYSGGYIVESLEAAIWSLLQTDSFEAALLTAVNLGYDTDTVAAIAGGLAGLYYGYDQIPKAWLAAIPHRDALEEMCEVEV